MGNRARVVVGVVAGRGGPPSGEGVGTRVWARTAEPMLRRHCAPRYPSSPEHVRLMSWNGGFPMMRASS